MTDHHVCVSVLSGVEMKAIRVKWENFIFKECEQIGPIPRDVMLCTRDIDASDIKEAPRTIGSCFVFLPFQGTYVNTAV